MTRIYSIQHEASKYITEVRLVALVSKYSLLVTVSSALCISLPRQLPIVKCSVSQSHPNIPYLATDFY